jgi:hypothetical protein
MDKDLEQKINSLSKQELIIVLRWTFKDLHTAGQNRQLNEFVRGWCRMLYEAIEYQIDKAIRSNEEE